MNVTEKCLDTNPKEKEQKKKREKNLWAPNCLLCFNGLNSNTSTFVKHYGLFQAVTTQYH